MVLVMKVEERSIQRVARLTLAAHGLLLECARRTITRERSGRVSERASDTGDA